MDEHNTWAVGKVETLAEIKAFAELADKMGTECDRIEAHLDQRYWLMRKANEHWRTALTSKFDTDPLKDSSPAPKFCDELIFDLAMLDLFVEKAQDRLTKRAESNQRSGFWYSIIAIAILVGSAATLFFKSDPATIPTLWPSAVYKIMATSGIVGLMLGAVYILLMIARASLHEATVLLNRRHSLRLGRLYLYLKLTSASTAHELRELKKDMDAQEIEGAFGWNLETSTAYKDIKGEGATSTLMGQVMQTVQKGFEAFKVKGGSS